MRKETKPIKWSLSSLIKPTKWALSPLVVAMSFFPSAKSYAAETITATPDQKSRYNILFISVDDLNDWVGVYGGNPQCKTPNMDRFAERAMVFRNASCPGPVCGPSRSALLSGFMPSTTGLYGNSHNMLQSPLVQTHATLPEYFSKHGYLTLSRGKVFHKHSTANGLDFGQWAFDVWKPAPGRGKIDPSTYFSRNKGIIRGKKIPDAKYAKGGGSEFAWGEIVGGNAGTKDYETAKWFGKKLQQAYDKPFFMAVGISKPHLKWNVPREYYDLYDLDSVIVPIFKMDDLDDIVDSKGKQIYKAQPDFLWCQKYGVMKEAVRAYMAATSYADACVGVVLDALEKSPYADNTIVIIWGDHGWHLGEKLRFRKATLWREGTQLPLMIRLPGMSKMQNCTRNVNLIDLYPTLIDLCGLPEKELDGKSIKPLLKNPNLEWTPAVTTYGKGNHSVISEKWHYITRRNGADELYHLEKDPMEWTNLIAENSKETTSAIKQMRAYLPKRNAKEIKKTKKDRSVKNIDKSIKKKRSLETLR